MRIAYLSTDRGIAFGGSKGASVHVDEMVAALAGEGSDVLLLMAAAESLASQPTNVTVEVLPGPPVLASAEQLVAHEPDLVRWLIERLNAFQPDALYERLALYSAAGAQAATTLGVPHIVELNAPLLAEAARFRTLEVPSLADDLEATTLRSADVVLAVSPPLAEYARSRGARRVEISQNAAAIERYPRRVPTDGPVRAVFAGSLRPWHGLETIADAWQTLGSSAPPLLVVGDGPARDLLAGIGATFSGAVDPASVPALLASADIGLAPYGRDTPSYFSPIKLFEYLAAGLATVVGDLPAVTSVVDRDSAVVIPAGDASALADAVQRLCADREGRRRLGLTGRKLIASAHTWRHRARRVRALAEDLALSAARA